MKHSPRSASTTALVPRGRRRVKRCEPNPGQTPVAAARRLLERGVAPVEAAVEVGSSIRATFIDTSSLGSG